MLELIHSPKIGRVAKWKARRLTTDRKRKRLAAGIERTIAHAEATPGWLSSAIPVQSRGVLAARDQLVEIAERLRAPRPVYAQGVALVADLLSNSESPLYRVHLELDAVLHNILAALDGHFDNAQRLRREAGFGDSDLRAA